MKRRQKQQKQRVKKKRRTKRKKIKRKLQKRNHKRRKTAKRPKAAQIKRKRQAQKQIKMEEKHIPEDIDYEDVKNLALEAKQKLSEIRPLTIGQASRISGINPADISVLLIYLKQKYNGE